MEYTKQHLRSAIADSLRDQGFLVDGDRGLALPSGDKQLIRQLHSSAIMHQKERSRPGLARHESRLLTRLASGDEVNVSRIFPKLIEVSPRSEDELLFRYAKLHWSIPVSSGYGRRLRFLVVDQYNDKLMGIIGLGDPVFNFKPRDEWIGWNKSAARMRLRHVMDMFVLGSVPPYSLLLCGKLTALLATSDEVRESFARKYSGRGSLISEQPHDGRLALLTTASALGRSSIYNRLKFGARVAFHSVGFTKGYGEFQFSNGLYAAISDYAAENLTPTAKHASWGTGFRNRREIVRKVLQSIELSGELLHHGVRREAFVAPLAKNSREFLTGQDDQLVTFRQPVADLFEYFRTRWLIPRSTRDSRYRQWSPEEWRLWS